MKHLLVSIIVIVFTACSSQTEKQTQISAGSASGAAQLTEPVISDSALLQKKVQIKMYSRAIAAYINAVYEKDKKLFDTLFFLKRSFGQPDDFPNIELPKTIQNTKIRLVEADIEGVKTEQEKHKARFYINMFGWVEKETAEFIFITFSNGGEHLYDCFIDFKYKSERDEFELEKLRFEVYIFDKERMLERIAIYKDGKYAGDKPIEGNKK